MEWEWEMWRNESWGNVGMGEEDGRGAENVGCGEVRNGGNVGKK